MAEFNLGGNSLEKITEDKKDVLISNEQSEDRQNMPSDPVEKADFVSEPKVLRSLSEKELNDPDQINVTIADKNAPLVILFGPPKCGKTMLLVRLTRFLKARGVDWKNIISKKLLPDDSIYVIINNTFFIIECKFQQVAGSVDEKLQTCDFKKKQYQKLLSNLNMEVEYVYLLSNWFRKPEYRDVLDYIISVHCRYYFEYIPLQVLGLPIPPNP